MPLNSQIATNFVKDHGKEATLRTFTDSGNTDKQGETIFDKSETTVKVVRGFGTNTRVPERLDTPMGESRPMDFEFIIRDEEAPAEPETTGKLPEIVLGNKTYRVLDLEDMRIGVKRLLCESER